MPKHIQDMRLQPGETREYESLDKIKFVLTNQGQKQRTVRLLIMERRGRKVKVQPIELPKEPV